MTALRLGAIALEVACRRLDSAYAIAHAELDHLLQTDGQRLAIADVTRELGEILILDLRYKEARAHIFEARRRYRPFRHRRRHAGEVDLLLSNYAFRDGRSGEGQEILDGVLASCAYDADARLVWARAARLEAHFSVVRGDLQRAATFIDHAIEGTEQPPLLGRDESCEPQRCLARSQYLFTKGEIALLCRRQDAARAFTEYALEFTERVFVHEPGYLAFARERARHALEVIRGAAVIEQDADWAMHPEER